MRTAPKRIRKRPKDPLDGNLGMVLFGQAGVLGGKSVLLVAARVGSVRRLPPGYELNTCQKCSSSVWVNCGFMASSRRRGVPVHVECSVCAMGTER